MEFPLSGLRILGVVFGIFLLLFGTMYFRGARWDRVSFIFTVFFGFGLVVVAAFPQTANWLLTLFDLTNSSRGRLISLLIIAVLVLFVLQLGHVGRVVQLKQTLDKTIRMSSIRASLEYGSDITKIAKMWDVLVIIPAYNEEENLAELLKQINCSNSEVSIGVAVIDDGSSDRTVELARENGAIAISNLFNRGQGSALRVGYDLAKLLGVKACVTMDADMQHRPSDLPALIEPILHRDYDLVIGSRRLGEAVGGSSFRSVGINLMSKLVTLLTGQKFTDVSSGYKAFRLSKLSALTFQEDQFQAAEVLITSLKNGLRVTEVPVTIDPRLHGETKKGTDISYGTKFLLSMIKAWWS